MNFDVQARSTVASTLDIDNRRSPHLKRLEAESIHIMREGIPIVPLYFAKPRPVVRRGNDLIVVDDARMRMEPGEKPEMMKVRFRTLGCYPVTGAVESDAETIEDIVYEMLTTRVSERQGRAIDRDEAAAMERKKRDGYF